MTASSLYTLDHESGKAQLHPHPGQQRAWLSDKRFIFVLAGTQGGKTSFGPWWLSREILLQGSGDYIAATSNYDLFKLKMLPEMLIVFETILDMGRYWSGDRVLEIRNPETGEFQANRSQDPMWARVILRAASAEHGLESSTAKAAWLDEVGQDDFKVSAWEAIQRRLSLSMGRVLATTTLYNLGWLHRLIYKPWKAGKLPDTDVIRFDSTENPLFPVAEFERAKRVLPEWKFDMQYRAVYTRPAGMIYKDFVDEYRKKLGHKVKPFKIPDEWDKYLGVDPGGVNTGMVWVAHNQDVDEFFVYRENKDGDRPTREHVEYVQDLAEKHGEYLSATVIGQRSEKQYRYDWEDLGMINVEEPRVFGVEEGIDRVIALLRQHRIFFFDSLELLLAELTSYSRVLDAAGEPTQAIQNKNKFHMLDALRYVISVAIEGAQLQLYIADD